MASCIPDIAPLVQEVLGRPYSEVDCWGLVRHFFGRGWGLDLDRDPQQAATAVTELWWQEDPRDPLTLVQPWDLVILRTLHAWSSHVGIVTAPNQFVHTRPRTGVVLESLASRRRRLLQVARLQRLL